ncbi:hypothetical protein G3I36_24885, partial [Streptomyces sp. SID10362]|nr:hypothetical protein [Streptomyces sp. SID10362]
MGFLDRLRGRRDDVGDGDGGEGALSAAPSPDPGADGSTASTAGPASGPASGPAPVAVAAWTGLPPIQRATGAARTGVADAGFGGRLPTWQNPSFTSAPSPAVLNPAAGDSLLSGAFGTPARQPSSTRLASPSGPPPVQRMPVAPLRAIPAETSETGAPSAPTGSVAPTRTSASGAQPRTSRTRRGASAPAPAPQPAPTATPVQRAA